MIRDIRRLAIAALAVLAVGATGCSSNNTNNRGRVYNPASSRQVNSRVSGTIQQVNARQGTIDVNMNGRRSTVRYDGNTVVEFDRQRYAVTALERGDEVTMDVQAGSRNQLFANRIDVVRSVRNGGAGIGSINGRNSTSGRVQQYTGTIQRIDQNRGTFDLQTRTGTLFVTLPYNAPQATLDYIRRLHNRDNVRIEGTPSGNGTVELYRFL